MVVDLEIHAPGLDMAQNRWSYHLIFIEEVHEHVCEVASAARERYESEGRGTLLVSQEQWREILRRAEDEEPFPCSYVPVDEAAERFDFDVLTDGFVQVLERYDPQRQFVLTVNHPEDGLLSCYLITPGASVEER